MTLHPRLLTPACVDIAAALTALRDLPALIDPLDKGDIAAAQVHLPLTFADRGRHLFASSTANDAQGRPLLVDVVKLVEWRGRRATSGSGG